MKRFAIAVAKRLFVSVVALLALVALGFAYVSTVGPSHLAAACILLLPAWPWALPQTFAAVSLFWFLTSRIKHWHISKRIQNA